jgi:hypothetical protein
MIPSGFIRNRSAPNIGREHRISEKPELSGFSFHAISENLSQPAVEAGEQAQLSGHQSG